MPSLLHSLNYGIETKNIYIKEVCLPQVVAHCYNTKTLVKSIPEHWILEFSMFKKIERIFESCFLTTVCATSGLLWASLSVQSGWTLLSCSNLGCHSSSSRPCLQPHDARLHAIKDQRFYSISNIQNSFSNLRGNPICSAWQQRNFVFSIATLRQDAKGKEGRN